MRNLLVPIHVSTCSSTPSGISVAPLATVYVPVAGFSQSCRPALSMAVYVMTDTVAPESRSAWSLCSLTSVATLVTGPRSSPSTLGGMACTPSFMAHAFSCRIVSPLQSRFRLRAGLLASPGRCARAVGLSGAIRRNSVSGKFTVASLNESVLLAEGCAGAAAGPCQCTRNGGSLCTWRSGSCLHARRGRCSSQP